MDDEVHPDPPDVDELLRQALLDADASASVALTVHGLPLSDEVTVIFHGRRDLGTIQTFVTPGHRGAGASVSAAELLRVPCDLDLADAEDREDAERLYAAQARAMRDALVGADTVLEIWREPLAEMAQSDVAIEYSVELDVALPAHRLLPVALIAPERSLVVTPVCGAQDVARVYPLPDDPERCLDDFLTLAAEHAQALATRLEHQEASVQRFLELNGDAE